MTFSKLRALARILAPLQWILAVRFGRPDQWIAAAGVHLQSASSKCPAFKDLSRRSPQGHPCHERMHPTNLRTRFFSGLAPFKSLASAQNRSSTWPSIPSALFSGLWSSLSLALLGSVGGLTGCTPVLSPQVVQELAALQLAPIDRPQARAPQTDAAAPTDHDGHELFLALSQRLATAAGKASRSARAASPVRYRLYVQLEKNEQDLLLSPAGKNMATRMTYTAPFRLEPLGPGGRPLQGRARTFHKLTLAQGYFADTTLRETLDALSAQLLAEDILDQLLRHFARSEAALALSHSPTTLPAVNTLSNKNEYHYVK